LIGRVPALPHPFETVMLRGLKKPLAIIEGAHKVQAGYLGSLEQPLKIRCTVRPPEAQLGINHCGMGRDAP
jgi:hypothetical protein